MKVLFGMALRQATGSVASLLRLIGPDRAVPDFGTPSQRRKTLKVNLPHRGSDGPVHLPVDGTGIGIEGEGEGNARRHGGTKRRVWREIHIGIDAKSPEIRAAGFTTGDMGEGRDRGPPGRGGKHLGDRRKLRQRAIRRRHGRAMWPRTGPRPVPEG